MFKSVKRGKVWLAASLVCAAMLQSACGADNGGANNSAAPSASGGQEAPAERINIELMEVGWVNTPVGDNDPYKQWIDDKFNVNFKLTALPAADMEARMLTRFASQEPPDIIFTYDKNQILKLQSQGVLMDDVAPLLEKLPSINEELDENAKTFVTLDGQMIGIPRPAEQGNWTVMIRKDWLANLDLDMPQTDEELMNVIRKFTFDDPDRNGKPDTWGISSAGGGSSLGEIANLQGMFGQFHGFYIEDNAVAHAVTIGVHKQLLDFVKTLVDEKTIDPDWYTQGWEQRKPKLFGNKIGIAWYPGSIVAEHESLQENRGDYVDVWEAIPMPKGSDNGGVRPPNGLVNGMYAISANAAKDPAKLEKIAEILEGVSYPNEGYWALRWGVGSDGQEVLDLEDGFKFYTEAKDKYRKEYPGAWDYGTWIGTSRDKVIQSTADEPNAAGMKQLELDEKAKGFTVSPNYNDLLELNPQLISDVGRVTEEFQIKYILGKETDYDKFVDSWMKAGGKQLLEEADKQFKAMGLIQ
ncbi:extracellular solute-binding protein [Paenibacillaceae bacterium WGS1546]|uniref:extracellular solute-binding protein n=1 Tax=Cohnella sp. WGS1546 TaxID=3366810 RepID=UPI00372D6BDD